ncbi:MAG: bifunctional ADP-dependent NAD(P)H-hydrate dehydratase/NAD(P)H-hydrate epimerase, partial [Verrucomicrobia bacterium]|nr:bifunctional ADP-dependent NAD(P)H-hydrate dehydratase/NAD(P)H-hydrate epimerase [Cytophagales bacterium]
TTYETFENLLRRSPKSLILSNDAVKIICRNRYLLSRLPENSVLILEVEDFKELTDYDREIRFSNDFERLEALRKFAARYKIVVVFKAGTTYTILPNGEIYFNLTGNTGLVTAGTDPILTGMITSFASQGYETWQAAVLAIYLQGIAADMIALKKGTFGWVASELLDYIGAGISKLV